MIVVAWVICGVAFWLALRKAYKLWAAERHGMAESWFFGAHLGGGFGGVLMIAVTVCTLNTVLRLPYQIEYLEEKQQILTERYETQAAMVRTELAKYPEYEQRIVGEIDPAIVLSWPILKTSETIKTMVETLVELKDDLYEVRIELAEKRTDYDFRRNVYFFVP